MKLAAFAIALALTDSALHTQAQSTSGTPPANIPGGGLGQGPAGMHQLPSPEKMAKRLMQKFDADKDGELSQSELTQALEDLRARRPSEAGGASQGVLENRTLPPAEQVAAHMIQRFSADKKGLTVAELARAIEARRANHGQPGGRQTGAQPASPTS